MVVADDWEEDYYDDEDEDDVVGGHWGQEYYSNQDAVESLTDEAVDDARLLTGVVTEPVSYVWEDPTEAVEAVESASDERLGHMKRSWRGRARAGRRDVWIPPDLRPYGSPVFWSVRDEEEGHGVRRGAHMTPLEIVHKIRRRIRMQVLVSCPELAVILQLDQAVVEAELQTLHREGKVKSVRFGCLMRRTARYWEARERIVTDPGKPFSLDAFMWHGDNAIGSLLRYDMPRVESVNQAAVKYARGGWELKGIAWVERSALLAVGLYEKRGEESEQGLVHFVWIPRWDDEREIWERLGALPEAVEKRTGSGLSGHVALVGPDWWSVTRALPMAVERLGGHQVRPSNISAWTYSDGWQAASGASMLGCGLPFKPAPGAAAVDKFSWPWPRRSLGRATLESVIKASPWTRRDGHTLHQAVGTLGDHPGISESMFVPMRGRSNRDRTARKSLRKLVELGLAVEAGIAGVVNMPASERANLFSERGQGRMRYRLSLSAKHEQDLAGIQTGEPGAKASLPTGNGAYRLMLDDGGQSYREIVRRSGLLKIGDRLGIRRNHDDILDDLFGWFSLIGILSVPASRAITANSKGQRVEPDGMLNCSSPAGNGPHYFELELSHLGPAEVRVRIERYSLLRTSYPLAVICGTDLGARHFDEIGQELGVPVVATSLDRLKRFEKIGLEGPAWIYRGQEVCVTAVPCPPAPADH